MPTKASTLEELFLDEIRDLYDAEKQLVKALPKMAKASISEDLKAAFTMHLEQTQGHVSRLEQVFEELGEKPRAKKCAAMAGLVAEGQEMIQSTADTPIRDAGLIAAAQKVEHYEMASYGSARTHAELLGQDKAVELLEATLEEEKETDAKLSELAQTSVNEDAAAEEPSSSKGSSKSKKTRSAGN